MTQKITSSKNPSSSEASAASPAVTRSKKSSKQSGSQNKSGKPGKGHPKKSPSDSKKKKRKVQNVDESVDAFAKEAAIKQTSWFESWKKPAWMPSFTLTVTLLAAMVEFQAKHWTKNGIPSNPLALDWTNIAKFSNVTLSDVTLCFLTGMAVEEKDIREVFKLTVQFVSSSSFCTAVEEAFVNSRIQAKYDYSTPLGAVLALCYAPAKLRRVVREAGQLLMKKEAKMPEDVSDFEADVAAINKALKARDRKFQSELKVLQQAVKVKLKQKEAFEKETSEFRNFIKEYYGVRSGKVDANVKQKLVIKYNASESLSSKYSLEQFISLYGQTTAIKRVQSKLVSFRGHEGFKAGCQWLEKQSQASEDEADSENEEMEDDGSGEVDEDAISSLGA
jgi:hypothetical protein